MLVGVGKAWLLLTSADCKYFECHIKLHVGSVSTRQGGGGAGGCAESYPIQWSTL